jgi:hypothetical protein
MSLFPFWLQQVVFQLPGHLICLAGFIAAAVWYRRHPLASVLTMVGTGLMVVTAGATTVIQTAMVQYNMPHSQWMATIGILSAIGRSAGLALVLVAVFVGRQRL